MQLMVQISCMGSKLEERLATPLQFSDMLRHPRAVDHGWRMVGCCTFRIKDVRQ